MHVVRIGAPSDWTSAPLTFQMAALPLYPAPPADADYLDLFHVAQAASGAWTPYEVSVPAVIPGSLLLLPSGFGNSISWLRLRSGMRNKPVVQAADRTFTLVFDSA
jgi:hypothetical protein